MKNYKELILDGLYTLGYNKKQLALIKTNKDDYFTCKANDQDEFLKLFRKVLKDMRQNL